MDKYQIPCTEEQAQKALELGAPIKHKTRTYYVCLQPSSVLEDEITEETDELIIPTTDQMIGWLNDQNIAIDLHTYFTVDNDKISHYGFTVSDLTRISNGNFLTREEATLEAIDVALSYLIERKQEIK